MAITDPLDCLTTQHCAHLRQDIDQFIKSIAMELVDKHELQKELTSNGNPEAEFDINLLTAFAVEEKNAQVRLLLRKPSKCPVCGERIQVAL